MASKASKKVHHLSGRGRLARFGWKTDLPDARNGSLGRVRRRGAAVHRKEFLGEGKSGQRDFYMPYAYLTDAGLAGDFWVIRLMEGRWR